MTPEEISELLDAAKECDRLRNDMNRMVSGFRSHLADLIRRIGPARLPMDIKAKLEEIHDSYNAWGDKSAEAELVLARRRIEELEKSLAWSLMEIRNRSTGCDDNGTPEHVCEFETAPDRGKCDFHEGYWSAVELINHQSEGGA